MKRGRTSRGVRLVVTDLDGTLWERADAVPERTRSALTELEARGVPLLVATGRRVASARGPLAAIGLAPPAVVLNGGLGLDLATGRRFHRGGYTVTVAPATVSKWDGVRAFCIGLGIDTDFVLAIGDGPDDAELLANAAVAVVPDDAHPTVRSGADHVVGRAADGGWADVLELL